MKGFFITAAVFVLAVFAWIFANPFKGFGVSFYGLTTYELLPIPVFDFQVRADGSFRTAAKTHDLTLDQVAWIIQDKPEALIIATGWSGRLVPRPEIKAFLQGYNVETMKTGEAIERYNSLIGEGKRAAIYLHSTD